MSADNVHVHIHFGNPDAAAHPAADYSVRDAAHTGGMDAHMPPFRPEEFSAPAVTGFAPWPAAPDACAADAYMPAHTGGLPVPMQLPLQPLTRLVAFDDSLADLVSEVDSMLELHGGRRDGLRAALQELPAWGPPGRGASANSGHRGDPPQQGLGMQRLNEWVAGQTGACMAANGARGVPRAGSQESAAQHVAREPGRGFEVEGRVERTSGGAGTGSMLEVDKGRVAGDAVRRRRLAVETQTAWPPGRRLDGAGAGGQQLHAWASGGERGLCEGAARGSPDDTPLVSTRSPLPVQEVSGSSARTAGWSDGGGRVQAQAGGWHGGEPPVAMRSSQRGRGGTGYPDGHAWEGVRNASALRMHDSHAQMADGASWGAHAGRERGGQKGQHAGGRLAESQHSTRVATGGRQAFREDEARGRQRAHANVDAQDAAVLMMLNDFFGE